MRKADTVIRKRKENDMKRNCCICGIELRKWEGRNPYPLKEEGECCELCNYEYVIPARSWQFFHDEK